MLLTAPLELSIAGIAATRCSTTMVYRNRSQAAGRPRGSWRFESVGRASPRPEHRMAIPYPAGSSGIDR